MKTPFFLLICFILLSCSVSESEKSLEVAENIIEFRPDSALSIIRKTDASELASRRLKAKHAVLHAMALDKCYIDITSDSIIAPALEYYKRHGSAEYKLKANYYRGVIARNSGDWDTAMTYYVMAERFADKCKDKKAVARLHNAKMYIYIRLYKYGKAAEEGSKAAYIYHFIIDTNRFINTMLDVGVAYKGQKNLNMIEKVITELKPLEDSFTQEQAGRFMLLLIYTTNISDRSLFDKRLDDYMHHIQSPEMVNWVSAAEIYLKNGRLDSSKQAIENAWKYLNDKDRLILNKVSAKAYYDSGDYEKASHFYKEYVDLADNTDTMVFNSEAEYIEDIYIAKIKILRKKYEVAILCLSLTIFILLGATAIYFILMHNRRLAEEKNKFEEMYRSLLREQEALKKTRENRRLNKEVLSIVEERLNVLNKFVAAHISSSFSKEASLRIKSLMENREYFLESTRMSFALSHHRFLKFLADQGLTNWEIGCCCLYCIGLNGNEIGEYLERKAYYKMSGKIRSKLGLDRSINLDMYLLKKIKEFNH